MPVNVEPILSFLFEPMLDIAVDVASGVDPVPCRSRLDELVASHSRDLVREGVPHGSLEVLRSLLWDAIVFAISKKKLNAKVVVLAQLRRLTSFLSPENPSALLETLLKGSNVPGHANVIESEQVKGLEEAVAARMESPITGEEIEESFHAFFDLDSALRDKLAPGRLMWSVFLTDTLKAEVAEALNSVAEAPWSFDLYVRTPLPAVWSEVIGRSSFRRSNLAVGEDNPEFDLSDVYHTDSETTLQKLHVPKWDEERYYLYHNRDGYITREPNEREGPVHDLRKDLKSLLGLCIAMGILELGDAREWDHVEPVFVFGISGGVPMQLGLRWLPFEESAVVGALRPVQVESENQKSHLKRAWSWIAAALRGEDGRLAHAGRWLFESYCGTNPLLQLIQATTTLEILLGEDKEKSRRRSQLGTTELLANRYAYLVGSSHASRVAAEKEFREVYDTRSRVVHSGKDLVDVKVLEAARTLCKKVIARELAIHTEV
jgi:hypothetical protein